MSVETKTSFKMQIEVSCSFMVFKPPVCSNIRSCLFHTMPLGTIVTAEILILLGQINLLRHSYKNRNI